MAFASIFIPNFMLQAVVRSELALRDRAVAVLDETAPVWSVVACNEAAAKAGIANGMTKSQVQQFLGIEIRYRSPTREKAAHAALLDAGWSLSPRVEDTAPDTIVLDLAGLTSLFGPDEQIASQLAERAEQLGLAAHVAVAPQIESATVAARGFPGTTVIVEGAEPEILGRLPVNALSPSWETLQTLDRWGIRTCAEFAALPVLQLSERLGQEGVRLHELAKGRSERSMVLAEPAIRFEEGMELEDAVEELEPLSFLLGRLLGQLCARLEARSLAACAVRVRFELDHSFEADSQPNRKSGPGSSQRKARGQGAVHLPQRPATADGRRVSASSDAHGASTPEAIDDAPRLTKSYERDLSLPIPIRNSKTLLNLLRLHLQSDPPCSPILKIILSADAARPRVAQGGLFLPSSPDAEKLELTIARIANVVGDSNIGAPDLMDTHRPGEFRMRRFIADRLFQGESRSLPAAGGPHSIPAKKCRTGFGMAKGTPRTGFRVFRPAAPAKVDLCEGCPARIRFEGRDGRVVAASGPWRSSGDWWREDGWQNDEWDLEIVFCSAAETRVSLALHFTSLQSVPNSEINNAGRHGYYRIFFDSIRKEWFVRGAYD
jgi:protein ImuB